MSLTININGLTLCHRGSGGVTHNTLPDVCKTPDKGIPKPFDNEAYSKDLANGTTTVFADGGNMIGNFGSIFAKSSLDAGGMLMGIKSGTVLAEADFITHSFDVFFEGKAACRLTDKMWMNHRNTVNMSGFKQDKLPEGLWEKICAAICECRKKITPTRTQVAEAVEEMLDTIRGIDDQTWERPSAVNETHQRQACFAEQFNASGSPWYGATPKDPKVLTEVPYKIPTDLITSGTGRMVSPGEPAHGSVQRALSVARGNPGTVVIWDMVTVTNPNLSPTWSNVKNAIEIKFAGDKWTPNQEKARLKKSVAAKLMRIDEEECYCDQEENDQRRETNKVIEKFGENVKKLTPFLPPIGPRFPIPRP